MENRSNGFYVNEIEKWEAVENLRMEGYAPSEIQRAIAVVLNNNSEFQTANYYYGFEHCVRTVLERGRY